MAMQIFESSVIWPFVGNFTRRVPITRSEHGKTPDSERILKRNQDTILEQNGRKKEKTVLIMLMRK